jgi:hypothetical protein
MFMERVATQGVTQALSVDLEDGHAEVMGGGLFMLFQEADGEVERILVSADDLRRLLAHIC